MTKNKFIKIIFLCLASTAFFSFIILCAGYDGFGIPSGDILKIRILRITIALIAGFALAEAGVCFQMVFSNPLADPYILGSSSGAAFGIAALIMLGVQKTSILYPLTAGAASCAAVFVVLKISGGNYSRNTLILSGVAVNFFLSALVILAVTLRKREAYSVLYFMMGDMGETNIRLISAAGCAAAAASFFILRKARVLNALSFGNDLSRHLGVDFEKESKVCLILASFLTGCAVAISGTVGFIGLMAPHIARKFTGSDARFLFFAAGASGGILLLSSDFIARIALYPVEIPVGVITALLGAPFFLWLYRGHD